MDIPGDRTTTETLLPGVPTVSDLSPSDDQDWFLLNLLADYSYSVTVTTTDPNLNQRVELMDRLGNNLVGDAGNASDPASISFAATTTQIHYVSVFDVGADDTGDYQITLNADDNIRNSTATTTVLTSAAPLNSAIDVLEDVDVVAVELVEGYSYGFTATTTSADLNQRIELMDRFGNNLVGDAGNLSDPASTSYAATSTQTHYISVFDVGNDDTGDYSLSFNDDDNILNSTATTAVLTSAEPLNSAIDVLGDVDVVAVELIEGYSYGFTATTTSADLNQRIDLTDRFGNNLVGDSGNLSDPASTSYAATSTQTHYISVFDVGNDDTGDYSLSFNDDDNILNSTATTAVLTSAEPLNSAIDVLDDVDVVAVELVEGYSYGFTATTTSADLNQRIDLTDRFGNNLVGDSGNLSDPASTSYAATSTQTHYISVFDVGNDDTGDYSLSFNDDDNILNSTATTAVLTSAAPLNSAIDVLGDVDFVAVELVAGLSYGFEASTTSADMNQRINLADRFGNDLVGSTGNLSDPASMSHTATADGTYYISVYDFSNNDTGDYSLGMNDRDRYSAFISDAHAIELGDTVHSSINVLDDVDTFAINLVAGQTYSYCLSTPTDGLNVRLEVSDRFGNNLAADSGSAGDPAMVEFVASSTGTYHLQVFDVGGDDVGDYSLITFSGGDDNIVGTDTGEELHGGQGTDIITGLGGDDMIGGGEGDDTVSGGDGNDDISGDEGDDMLLPGTGSDTVDGGAGTDTVSYSDTGAVQVRLFGSRATGDGFRDTLINIENIIGSAFDDYLAGDSGANVIEGQGGNDRIIGYAGEDILFGGLGNDVMRGGQANDVLEGGDDDDRLQGELGDDILNGDAGEDFLFGGNGRDILNGGAQDDLLSGGTQSDVFIFETGSGFDRIIDWEDGVDLIDLTDFGFTDFADVQVIASQAASGVRLDFVGGETLMIGDLTLADLSADDFILTV